MRLKGDPERDHEHVPERNPERDPGRDPDRAPDRVTKRDPARVGEGFGQLISHSIYMPGDTSPPLLVSRDA